MVEFLCPSILRLGYPYSDRYQALFRIFTSMSESSLRVIVLSSLIDPYPEFNTEWAKCNAQTRLPIYRVRISSWISSWIFEFYTTYFVSGVVHRLEVFSRWRRTRMADRYWQFYLIYPSIAFVIVFLTGNNSWHVNECFYLWIIH